MAEKEKGFEKLQRRVEEKVKENLEELRVGKDCKRWDWEQEAEAAVKQLEELARVRVELGNAIEVVLLPLNKQEQCGEEELVPGNAGYPELAVRLEDLVRRLGLQVELLRSLSDRVELPPSVDRKTP